MTIAVIVFNISRNNIWSASGNSPVSLLPDIQISGKDTIQAPLPYLKLHIFTFLIRIVFHQFLRALQIMFQLNFGFPHKNFWLEIIILLERVAQILMQTNNFYIPFVVCISFSLCRWVRDTILEPVTTHLMKCHDFFHVNHYLIN